MNHESRNMKLATGLLSVVLAGGLLAGCSQTAAPEPSLLQRAQGETPAPPPPSGFLGNDYSLLTPPAEGSDQKAMLRYVAPNVNWSSYNKLMIAPVTFWAADDSKVSAADQQALCNYAYNEFVKVLGKNFILTGEPGLGVMKVSIALTDATSAVPGLRSISVIVPQARALSAIKMLATGSYAFVGSAQGAFKANDSTSGQLLAAAVDKRVGGTSIKNVAVFQWGDAQNAIDYWAQLTDQRLVSFGVQSSVAAR
ncbi:MAG: DUF3313 domain-containing protein [Candidatus Binataceae bacterium]|jgi:hypothetical protein